METAALSFERAWVLNALWLLPLVVALFWWAEGRRRSAIGRIVAPKLRALLAGSASPARRWFRSVCVILAMGLLIAALAGPRLGYDTIEMPHRGRDVVIAVDVSRSMLAPDVAPTRLERAKLFVEDLVGELGADRIGLVAFAGSAFLQAPLTLDHGAVLAATDELDTTLIPKGGTNLAAAIAAADEAFGKAEGFSRAVVIISDGEELSADGVAAAKNAAAQGVRIFTVGVGSTSGSEIPDGMGELVRDPATGEIVNSKLDEARMKEIAEVTGGFYTHLNDKSAALIALQGIAKMDEADFTANSSRRPIERYQWPLGAAIALLMLQALVGERRRRRRILAAAALAAMMFPAATWASPAGIEAYDQGNYEKAREAFEQRLRMEPDAPGLQLNAGAAAYRLKDYAKASQYFSRAALSNDPAVRSAAEFNFANTLFRQGEGQQDKANKITDWKEAIAKYDAALKTRPDYAEAKENKERVEQLLKELEKEQQQEQQQQQQQQQQKQDDMQQKQDQNQQQQQQGGDQKDQKDQKDQQQKQDQQSGSGQGADQQKQDQQDKGEQQKNEEKNGEQGQDKKDQQQGGQEKKEQESGSKGEQEDQQQKDDQKGDKQKDGKPEEQNDGKSGEEQKDQGSQGGQPRQPAQAGQGKPGEERAPVPQQSGEKKEGELKGTGQPGEDEKQEQAQVAAVAEEEEDGKMSESQARALLRSLQGEEDKVNLLERRAFQDVSKDW